LYNYFQCAECKTLFLHPQPLNDLKSIYPSNYYSFVRQKRNLVIRIKEWLDKKNFKKVLRKIDGSTITVLDVGGGTGWLCSVIKQCDTRVVSTQIVDIDSNAKELARQQGHEFFEGTLEEFTTTEKYDLILMLNLIEHVSSPLEVLKKVSHLLNPNGLVVVKTPNVLCWEARLFRTSYWGGLHCPRHWVLFSEKSFRRTLQNVSLEVTDLTYTQGAPFWAFSIIVLLYKKKWINISRDKPVIYHSLYPVLSGLFAALDFVRCRFTKTAQMFIILKNG